MQKEVLMLCIKAWGFSWRKRWDSNPRALADNCISSAARYNHFDTLPCINIHFLELITWFRVRAVMTTSIPLQGYFYPDFRPVNWRENQERKQEVLTFSRPGKPWKIRISARGCSKSPGRFRVSPVMTTSIRLRIYLNISASENGENWWGEQAKILS